jgi:hypothetical protein
MRNNVLRLILFPPLFVLSYNIRAQTIENLDISLEGDNIVISYDLIAPDPNEKFQVYFYSSHNNYSTKLANISGDAGNYVIPGLAKKAIWHAKKSFRGFDGDITIKLRASKQLAVARDEKLVFRSLDRNNYKKGKTIYMAWDGGILGQPTAIYLVKDGKKIQTINGNATNEHKYTWSLPKDSKAGKGYTIQVSSTSETVSSPAFKIKHKVPLLLKIIPFVGVGTVVYLLAGSRTEKPLADLPGPVKPN